jgi:hypothetical protein
MRRPPSAYPRAETQARVLERVEAGWTLDRLEALPGLPSRQTLYRWQKADPEFARRLAAAQAWRKGERRARLNAAGTFDAARAEAFLLRVRRGEAVRDLVRTPGQPHRDILNRWRAERPDFAEALEAAVRFSFEQRPLAWLFDQGVADEIVRRVYRGEPLPSVMKDPQMPGREALRRWRRARPDFVAALKMAQLGGHRRRMRARRRCTPELAEAIMAHIRGGGSLHSAARVVPGAPHHVTLYGWVRTNSEFAREVEWANLERDERMMDLALDMGREATPLTVKADAARFAALRQRLGRLSGGASRSRRDCGPP